MWEGFVDGFLLNPDDPSTAAGKTILIVGGAGGVGSIAIQLAKKVFKISTVIATASRPETVEYCKKMGADHVINHHGDLKVMKPVLTIHHVGTTEGCWN